MPLCWCRGASGSRKGALPPRGRERTLISAPSPRRILKTSITVRSLGLKSWMRKQGKPSFRMGQSSRYTQPNGMYRRTGPEARPEAGPSCLGKRWTKPAIRWWTPMEPLCCIRGWARTTQVDPTFRSGWIRKGSPYMTKASGSSRRTGKGTRRAYSKPIPPSGRWL